MYMRENDVYVGMQLLILGQAGYALSTAEEDGKVSWGRQADGAHRISGANGALCCSAVVTGHGVRFEVALLSSARNTTAEVVARG